ncbi:hypothetical protein IID19_05585, partial [Patescibacteria group bacterium]|nr:hypothetical protein [Patescibacteria group bacterium]
MEIEKNKSTTNQILDLLGPKKSFLFGIVAMVVVGSAVGFYILLFSGGISTTSSSDKETTFAGTTGTTIN